jgi:photosystem II stability/assembly factor-like uncharacterized protein/PKD repeat protein
MKATYVKKAVSPIFILLFFIMLRTNSSAQQTLINPAEFPDPSPEMPAWAKLLYQEPLNIFKIEEAFRAYYQNNPMPNEGEEFESENEEEDSEEIEEKEMELQYIEFYRRLTALASPYIQPDGTLKRITEPFVQKEEPDAEHKSNAGIWTPIIMETYHHQNKQMCPWQSNIYSFDVYPGNTNIMYAASETSGLYKTTDKGVNWVQEAMNFGFGGINAVKISPTNPDIVFVGNTNAIYKSTDGAKTWNAVLFVSGLSVYAIEVSALAPAVVLAATEKGIYRSSDGGNTWTQMTTISTTDLKINPKNPKTVYALEFDQTINFYECVKSTDQGLTFTKKNKGWVTGYVKGAGLIGLTASDTNRIYVVQIAKQGKPLTIIQKSKDGAMNWTKTGNGGMEYGQGYYDLGIVVSPTNPDSFMVGTKRLFQTGDGGAHFVKVSGSGGYSGNIHADIQCMKAIGNESWVASDGGINYSIHFFNPGSIQTRIKGLNGSGFWGFGSGWNEDVLVGGRYHNGNTAYHENYAGKFLSLGGAEQATGYVNPGNNRIVYHSDIGVRMLPSDFNGVDKVLPNLTVWPNEKSGLLGNSEMEWDPRCYNIFYTGRNHKLFKTTDGGKTFDEVFVSTDAGASIGEIEISRGNPDVIYIFESSNSPSNGKIYKTTDGGVTWKALTDLPGTKSNERTAMSLSVSGTNENVLWVGLPYGVKGNKIFKTTDGGLTWENLTTPAIANVRLLNIMHQMGTNGGVYLIGGSASILYRNNSMSDWKLYDSGLPTGISAYFVKPFYRDGKIRIASGFGIWEAPLFENSVPQAQPMVNKMSGKCVTDTFRFEDYSVLKHSGATWKWSFPGASYVSSTTIRNPVVVYTGSGNYSVTLTVKNPAGTSTKTLTNFISISGGLPVPLITFNSATNVLTSSASTGNQWYLNGVLIAGATQQTLKINKNGTYTVAVTDKNGCQTTSLPLVVTLVGIDSYSLTDQHILVYPNPSQGTLNIDIESVSKEVSIKLSDVLGQLVYAQQNLEKNNLSSQTFTVKVDQIQTGIYFLRIKIGEESFLRKVCFE